MTPPSVRFLGRKVYLGAVVVLVAAMRQGPSPRRVRELSRLFGADRHTIARWRVFWSEHFPQTPFWKVARGRLVPAVEIAALPLALLEAFLRSDDPCRGLGAAAGVSLADHDRRGPGDRGFSIIPPGPQKMRVDGPGGPQSRWSQCRFQPLCEETLMTQQPDRSTSALWARFRFSVVGSLLSSPPARGELKAALRALADKTWTHPVSGREVRFAAVTIERWYYTAQREKDDPVGVLRRAVRKDCGKVSLAPALAERLLKQYHDHPHWSYQLHYDNLAAAVKADPSLGPLRSYSTVRRYMQAHGMVRKPRPAPKGRPGEALAAEASRSSARSAVTKPSTSAPCGISISTTARSRCSRPAASGSARWPWASSTITRGCAATSSGTSRRPPRISCMGSPRRSRNAACPGRC